VSRPFIAKTGAKVVSATRKAKSLASGVTVLLPP
jgi:hypothetical protein